MSYLIKKEVKNEPFLFFYIKHTNFAALSRKISCYCLISVVVIIVSNFQSIVYDN